MPFLGYTGHIRDILVCGHPAPGGCMQQLHGAFVPRAPCHHGNPEAFQAGTMHMACIHPIWGGNLSP